VKLQLSELAVACWIRDDTDCSQRIVEVSITLFRRSYQTAQSCKSCKAAVVNVLGKGGTTVRWGIRRWMQMNRWWSDETANLSGKILSCCGCWDKYGGYLIIGHMPTVIQSTWPDFGLGYGTRDLRGKGICRRGRLDGSRTEHSSEEVVWKVSRAKGSGYSDGYSYQQPAQVGMIRNGCTR
jgi:hypothetical protein